MSSELRAPDLALRHRPSGLSDRIAWWLTKLLRFFADTFFAHCYGHRAVVLETVAAVPGMVGGMMNHLKSLRRMRDDDGWIRELLDEAENERMHLMAFVALAQPNWFERGLVLLAQGVFWNAYFLLYLFHNAPRTGWSATSRKRRSSATPSSWPRSTQGGSGTSRRRTSRKSTGR